MLFSHKFLLLLVLCLGFVAVSPHDVLANGDEAPIIALSNNNIYFVSPSNGRARLIVERDPEKDALLAEMNAGSALELSPISPDSTQFAYTTPLYEVLDPKFEDRRHELASLLPRELFLVNIASGQQTRITNYGANFSKMVESDKVTNISHLTWSYDAQRLYFLSSVLSMRNRVPQKTIEYYDLISGERRVLVKLRSQVQVVALYGVIQYANLQGLVLLERLSNEGDYRFTFYGLNGSIINSSELLLPGSQECPNSSMFDMNPVYYYIDYYYVYYVFKEATNESLPVLQVLESSHSIPLADVLFPAIMNHTHQDLLLVFDGVCNYEASDRWTLTDERSESIVMSVFTGIDHPSQIAFSPDGRAIAILNGETIRIIEINSEMLTIEHSDDTLIPVLKENATFDLDFPATRILWGAMDFTLAPSVYGG